MQAGSNLQLIYDCLTSAQSRDNDSRKTAESTLQSIESQPGFCSSLIRIIQQSDADHSARWLAAVHLKNTIAKHWRTRRDGSGVQPDEKQHVRHALLDALPQPDNQIAVQLAVAVSKIARIDFPREWPTLFSDLLGRLQHTQDHLIIRRIYLALHHALKELSSKRLAADKDVFGEVTRQLFDYLWQQLCGDMRIILDSLPSALQGGPLAAASPLMLHFERWLMLIKAVRRMLLFGFPPDALTCSEVPAVKQVMQPLLQCLQSLVSHRPQRADRGSRLHAMLDRGILKVCKTFKSVQQTHPWSLWQCGVLAPAMELFCTQICTSGEDPGPSHSLFIVQCLACLFYTLDCKAYSGVIPFGQQANKERVSAASKQVQADLAAFWTEARLKALVQALVGRYLCLGVEDLQAWSLDGEEAYHMLTPGAWEDNLRASAQELFKKLMEAQVELLGPFIVDMLRQAAEECPVGVSGSPPAPQVYGVPAVVLHKEAVYCAASLAADPLFDYVSFQPWLHSSLLREASDAAPCVRPLQRRAVGVIGDFVARHEQADKPALYAVVLGALRVQDMCLQLTAVATLRVLLDDWGLNIAHFIPYAGDCIQALGAALLAATNLDSQTQIFSLLNLMLERISRGGEDIEPFSSSLLQLVTQLWQASEGQGLLRIQMLQALMKLTNAAGQGSTAYYPVLGPILQVATDLSRDQSHTLAEDGLQLLLVCLRNAPSGATMLLGASPAVAQCMEMTTEHVRVCMLIGRSTILLGGAQAVTTCGPPLCSMLAAAVGAVNERGMCTVYPVMQVALICWGQQGAECMRGPLSRLLSLVLTNQESSLSVQRAVDVFGRLVLHSMATLQEVLQAAAAITISHPAALAEGGSTGSPLTALLAVYLDAFDRMASPLSRVLCALACCRLLSCSAPEVLGQLPAMCAVITGVWHDMEAPGARDTLWGGYDLGGGAAASYDSDMEAAVILSEEATGECQRWDALKSRDPVLHTPIREALQAGLHACAAVHGPAFHTASQALDPNLHAQLQAATGHTAQ